MYYTYICRLTGLVWNLNITGGSIPCTVSTPTTLLDNMILPTCSELLRVRLRKSESVKNRELVILSALVILMASNKLLGSVIDDAGGASESPSKDKSSEVKVRLLVLKGLILILKVCPFSLNSSKSTCCADTANDDCAITTGSDVLLIGISSTTDSIASSTL